MACKIYRLHTQTPRSEAPNRGSTAHTPAGQRVVSGTPPGLELDLSIVAHAIARRGPAQGVEAIVMAVGAARLLAAQSTRAVAAPVAAPFGR